MKAVSASNGHITMFSWKSLPRCQPLSAFAEVVQRHHATGTPEMFAVGRNTKDTVTQEYEPTFGLYAQYCQKYDMSGTTIEFLFTDTRDARMATRTPGMGAAADGGTFEHYISMASPDAYSVCGQMLTNNTEHPTGVPMAYATPEQLRRLAKDFDNFDGTIDYNLDVGEAPAGPGPATTFGKATKSTTPNIGPPPVEPTAPTPISNHAPAANEHPDVANAEFLQMSARVSDAVLNGDDAGIIGAIKAAIVHGLGLMNSTERAQRVIEFGTTLPYYADLLDVDPETTFVFTPVDDADGTATPEQTAAHELSQRADHYALALGRHLLNAKMQHASKVVEYNARVLAAKIDGERFVSETATFEAEMKVYNSFNLKHTQTEQLKSTQAADKARRAHELNQMATSKGTDANFERDLNVLQLKTKAVVDQSTGKCAFPFYSSDGPYATVGSNVASVNVCMSKFVKFEMRSILIMTSFVDSGPPSLRTFIAAQMPVLAKTWHVDSTMRAFQIADISAMMLTCVMTFLDRCRTAYSFDNLVKMHVGPVSVTVVNKTLDLRSLVKGVARVIKDCADMNITREDPTLWTAVFTSLKWNTMEKTHIKALMSIELQGALETAHRHHLRGRHPSSITELLDMMRDYHTDEWKYEDAEIEITPDEHDATGVIAAMWGELALDDSVGENNGINAVNNDGGSNTDGGDDKVDTGGSGKAPRYGNARPRMHGCTCMKYLEDPSSCLDGKDCPYGHGKTFKDLTAADYTGLKKNFEIRVKEVKYDAAKLAALHIYDHHLCDAAAHLSNIAHQKGVAKRDRGSYVTLEQRKAAKKEKKRRAGRKMAAAAHKGTSDDNSSDAASETSALTDASTKSTFSAITRDMNCCTMGTDELSYDEVAVMIKDMAMMDGNSDVIDLLERYESGDETRYCMMVASYADNNFRRS